MVTKVEIKHQSLASEFWTDEQCHIIEASNSANDPDVSIARARVKPGVTTHWHKLDGITERYYILEGEGLVEVGELASEKVSAGATVIIPADEPQRITNIGRSDLIFLAICSPRFHAKAYIDLEK